MTETVLPIAPEVRPRLSLLAWLAAAALALASVFYLAPAIDLGASRLLADADRTFPLEHAPALLALNVAVNGLAKTVAWALVLATPLAWLSYAAGWRALAWLAERRRPLLYLALTFAVGPGLLVNSVLKEHSGRARPSTIVEFGGTKQFTRAFEPSDQCQHNCAFPSGHAAAATMPVAGFFLARSRRQRRAWLAAGVGGGFTIGLARMVTGGHFLSDIVFAVLITWLVAALCAAWLLRPDTAAPRRR